MLLAGFVILQYGWITAMQKEKLHNFKTRVTFGVNVLTDRIPLAQKIHDIADTTIFNILHQSFLAQGLGKLRFEYAVYGSEISIASPGFYQLQSGRKDNLVLNYELRRTGQNNHVENGFVTVVVPSWKKTALKEMGWIFSASIALTIMMMLIFFSASLAGAKDQGTPHDEKSTAIKYMMQQLEEPLSTVSVAADALRNDKVMHDPGKISYYQNIISEENERMNREVEKLMRINSINEEQKVVRRFSLSRLLRIKR